MTNFAVKAYFIGCRLERAKGIEPSYAAWEAAVLPLNYARKPLILFSNSYPRSRFPLSNPCQLSPNCDHTSRSGRLPMPAGIRPCQWVTEFENGMIQTENAAQLLA